jgi:NAD(P)-dependent dehydrogenase (short-subunit alcohol dehydrogenase family)
VGVRVVFVGQDENSGPLIEADLRSEGRDALFLKADLRIPEQVRQIVPEVIRVYGRLDFAFNNAGVSGVNKTLIEQSEAESEDVFQLNVKSVFMIMQQEIRQMLRQGQGGSIVNMASIGSLLATPGASIYVASKHAVVGFTKAAAIEYGPQGIRVNAVSPGSIRTEMLREVFGGDESLDRMAEIHPIRRIGFPNDLQTPWHGCFQISPPITPDSRSFSMEDSQHSGLCDRTRVSVPSLKLVFGWFKLQPVRG